MEATHIALIIGVLVLAVFLVLARKLLRLAFRLAVAGFLFVALLVAISIGFWQGWFNRQRPTKAPRPAPTRRVSSN